MPVKRKVWSRVVPPHSNMGRRTQLLSSQLISWLLFVPRLSGPSQLSVQSLQFSTE